ncbi:MAG: InlB B-repeat-containing protein, partial [Eubacterium sp.]|nr:InlB B-repeat-containing protein [Eubacterium sp.]
MKRFNKILTVFIAVVLAACIGSGFGITSFAADSYNNKYSLTIGENIVTNYEIDAKAYKAAGGETLEYSYLDATGEQITTKTETIDLTSAGDTVTFSVPQAAAQIAEPVTITVKSANGQNVDTFTASAKDYCYRYVDKTDAQLKDIEKGKRLREICRSVIAYAYAAQQQFTEYMNENEGTVPITNSYFTALDIPNTDYTDTTGRKNQKGTRVKFKSFSYFCTSTARLRFYLDTSTATQEELEASPMASNLPQGVTVSKGYDNKKGVYYIDVDGLTPLDFDKVFRIDYADAYISMSVLQYAGAIIASSKSTTESKNLARTLIAYYNKTVKYVDDNVTVSFDGNGGSAGSATSSTTIGNTVTLPTASRTDYTFDNWYTEASDGDLVGANGGAYAPKDDTTLYAHWLKNYKINITTDNATITVKRVDNNETVV